jgi:hypothetical protein
LKFGGSFLVLGMVVGLSMVAGGLFAVADPSTLSLVNSRITGGGGCQTATCYA